MGGLAGRKTGRQSYSVSTDSGTPDNKGGDGPSSTPAVIGGWVFVCSSTKALQCLDAASGKVVWEKDVIASFGGKNIGWQSATSRAVDGGLVYVAGGAAPVTPCSPSSRALMSWPGREGKAASHTRPRQWPRSKV